MRTTLALTMLTGAMLVPTVTGMSAGRQGMAGGRSRHSRGACRFEPGDCADDIAGIARDWMPTRTSPRPPARRGPGPR